jgi:hypothetical protein
MLAMQDLYLALCVMVISVCLRVNGRAIMASSQNCILFTRFFSEVRVHGRTLPMQQCVTISITPPSKTVVSPTTPLNFLLLSPPTTCVTTVQVAFLSELVPAPRSISKERTNSTDTGYFHHSDSVLCSIK